MIGTVAIVGTGTMGRGIAELAARAGYPVLLHDAAPAAAAAAIAAIGASLAREAERGRITAGDAAAATARLREAPDLPALAAADVVIEAIVEDLEVKRALFRGLEAVVPADAILATNTSSLSVTAIGAALGDPSRSAGLHFFNPPTRMRVVEVVRGAHTAASAIGRLEEFAARLGQKALLVPDSPGFLVNVLGRAVTGEGLRILAEGVADAATIDAIARGALGLRLGPFELLDLIGLDVSARVMEEIWTAHFNEPRFRPVPLIRQRVAAGLFGRKSGRGFYDYRPGAPSAAPATVAPGPARPIRLVGAATAFADLLPPAALGDGPEAVALVAPLGGDPTTAAVGLGLDPRRTVGIDGLCTRIATIAGTALTEPGALAAVASAFAGRAVYAVAGAAGFVADRLAAMMVLIAADAAGAGLATPADIDAAACLALGYPEGPLALGDRLGPARIAAHAAALHAATGDPRWRPSQWLSQRAALGLRLAV